MRGSIRLTRKHARARAHAEAIDIEKSVFHSSPAWMPPVSWSKLGQMSSNSGEEIALSRGARRTGRRGAAGGVGSFAVQFAKSGGLLVAATCGTPNVEYVRSLGTERVIDYKTERVCQAVRDWS